MKKQINKEQEDILRELINIGVGKGAEVLNTMIQSHIELEVPEISVISVDELETHIGVDSDEALSAVDMKYQGNFSGDIELVFPVDAASKLVSIITGDFSEAQDMDELRSSTLGEIGNVVLNAVIGSISNIFSFELSYSLPTYIEGDVNSIVSGISPLRKKVLVCARTKFKVEELEIEGNLIIFFSITTFEQMIQQLDDSADTLFSDS